MLEFSRVKIFPENVGQLVVVFKSSKKKRVYNLPLSLQEDWARNKNSAF